MSKYTFTHEQFLHQQLQDPEFRAAYEVLAPAYELKRLRILKRLSQGELARRVGTHQPSIARLESGQGIKNLSFLRRVAEALDAEIEIRIKPKTLQASGNAQARRKKTGKVTRKKKMQA